MTNVSLLSDFKTGQFVVMVHRIRSGKEDSGERSLTLWATCCIFRRL